MRVARKISIVSYILLVYSGLIKWIPGLPVDLTIAFTVLTAALIPFIFNGKVKVVKGGEKGMLVIVSCLSVLFLISNFYTISTEYAESKTLATIINLYCFLYPILFFRNDDFKFLRSVMMVFNIVILAILVYLYATGKFIVFQMSETTLESYLGFVVPNYLSIGTFMAAVIIMFIPDRRLATRAVSVFAVIMLFLLGGRGPLLFLPLIFIIYYFLTGERKLFTVKNFFLAGVALFLFLTFFDFGGIDFERFNLFKNAGEDASTLDRLDFLTTSYNSVDKHLWTGRGIGSSGIILSGQDIMLYPHNLFVESLLEVGLLGGLLYLALYIVLGREIWKVRKNRELLAVGLVAVYLFFQDLKSGSFDAWRISLMWIAWFIVLVRGTYTEIEEDESIDVV